MKYIERLNGIQWSWVQIPLRPAFYSYFKQSFSGEYHVYISTYVHKFTSKCHSQTIPTLERR